MKIKVLILFFFLLFGIGFEGFGQVIFEDYFDKVEIEVDTAHVPLYKKLQIIRKCEYVGVHNSGNNVGHYYRKKLNGDSIWDYEGGTSLTSRMILLSTQNNGIVDMVIQPRTVDFREGGSAAIWTLNSEDKYNRKKLFEGGSIQKIYRGKNNILTIDIQQQACCSNYFMCDETYSYKNDSLFLEKQMCYMYNSKGFEDLSKRKKKGVITTNDTTFLRGYNPMRYEDEWQDMINYGTESDSSITYGYEYDVLAVIKPNQKCQVLDTQMKDKIYCYLVVFPPQSIQRRVYDEMIGHPNKRLYFAGWITSEKPLKIEIE